MSEENYTYITGFWSHDERKPAYDKLKPIWDFQNERCISRDALHFYRNDDLRLVYVMDPWVFQGFRDMVSEIMDWEVKDFVTYIIRCRIIELSRSFIELELFTGNNRKTGFRYFVRPFAFNYGKSWRLHKLTKIDKEYLALENKQSLT